MSELSTSAALGIRAASTRPLNAATFAVLWEHHSYHPTLHASKMTLAKAEKELQRQDRSKEHYPMYYYNKFGRHTCAKDAR